MEPRLDDRSRAAVESGYLANHSELTMNFISAAEVSSTPKHKQRNIKNKNFPIAVSLLMLG